MSEPTKTVTATCETPNCGNNGVPIELTISAESAPAILCGACGTLITAVTDG